MYFTNREDGMNQVRLLYEYYRYRVNPDEYCTSLFVDDDVCKRRQTSRSMSSRVRLRQLEDEGYKDL